MAHMLPEWNATRVLELDGREVRFSNPDKVFFPARGHTKLDLCRYYVDVAEPLLRHMRDRLRLFFTCCHPALAMESRVALTLQLLGGLSTSEVARASGGRAEPRRGGGDGGGAGARARTRGGAGGGGGARALPPAARRSRRPSAPARPRRRSGTRLPARPRASGEPGRAGLP